MECDFDFDGVDFDEEMASQESEELLQVGESYCVGL